MKVEAIESVARRHGIVLLLQFGSTVTGRTHPKSDVDLAVLLKEVPSSFEALADLESLRPIVAKGLERYLARATDVR